MHAEYCIDSPGDGRYHQPDQIRRADGSSVWAPLPAALLRAGRRRTATWRQSAGWTNIFIYPGYHFKVLDGLITNFHLPESTLIMLVSALAGREHVLAAYEEAVRERYRFFSFGDAMFIS